MLKLAIILLSFVSNIFTPAMALPSDEIPKTDDKRVFNITVSNYTKRSQRVIIHAIAFLKNSGTPFSTNQSLEVAPQTTKIIPVKQPFCSSSASPSIANPLIGERDALSEASIKLFITDSTRRTTKVQYFTARQLKYVDGTSFVDLPASTFIIR